VSSTERTMYYAGIGSRKTPVDILIKMQKLAERLGQLGFVLRSGGADGADSAFEIGASGYRSIGYGKQIFLPWKAFNGSESQFHEPELKAYEIAAQYHPSWHGLTSAAKSLMARNVHQVLGNDLIKWYESNNWSDFVICWTPDGAEKAIDTSNKTGSTNQAIRIAYYHEIPVFNLYNKDAMERLTKHIETHPRYKK
jgi:hypothetical protein